MSPHYNGKRGRGGGEEKDITRVFFSILVTKRGGKEREGDCENKGARGERDNIERERH